MSIVKNITSVDNLDWREIVINWEGMGDDVTEIKAGTPMDADGNIANNSNCFGLMMGDVLRTRSRARVVISGPVDLDEAEANSGITLSEEAKVAMRDVWFPGKSGGGLPTGGAAYQQLVTDGEGNAKWEDRLAYCEGFCITWSGDSAGFNEVEVPVYKMTDRVFTFAELVGSTYIIHNNGVEEEYVITADNIVENNGALLVSLPDQPMVVSVSEPFSFFESPGTYFSMTSEYVYSSCIKKGEIAPVGMPFLPLNYRIKFTLTPGDVITGTCNATYYQLLNYVRNGDPIHATVFYQNGDKIVSAPVVSIVDIGVASIEFNFTDSDGLIGASTIYYNLVDGISVV